MTTGESIKDTVESILVAFILAFVFRAFVVEAFVIPSGSMATTLLGAHMRFRCEECGQAFTVNYTADGKSDPSIPSAAGPAWGRDPNGMTYLGDTVISAHCRRCGHKVPREQATNPPVHYGDRILVLKYLYLLQSPQRWDVVVFKSPTERDDDYATNFIKRLVGLPGESVMILDGDIYAAPAGTEQWTVQPKPRIVQDALWRMVDDADYQPRRQRNRAWTQPWQAETGAGWDTSAGKVFAFRNEGGAGTLLFNRNANPGAFPFTDWLPYNETRDYQTRGFLFTAGDHYNDQAYASNTVARWHVSDLKASFFYQRLSGDGPMSVSLTKLGRTFTARLDRGGAVVLDGEKPISGPLPLPRGGRPVQVEFQNVDYRVTLRLDGRDVFSTTPRQYAPDLQDLRDRDSRRNQFWRTGGDPEDIRNVFPAPEARLAAERQACTISHLSLWRDVYYTPSYRYHASSELLQVHGQRNDYWGSPQNPITLARRGPESENEYFVLGDNSIMSGDARQWHMPIRLPAENLYAQSGRVPERFMIGKAFFVYWPAGFRPFGTTTPGLVPNFGEMRFIH